MRPRQALILVGVMVAVAITCFGEAWQATHQPRRLPAVASSPARLSAGPARQVAAHGVPLVTPSGEGPVGDGNVAVAPPVRVDVPTLGVSAPVTPVGLTADGSIDIPSPAQAGWYTGGPAPGAVGPAVLVGHVDSQSGPAVFYPLVRLHPGDLVTVTRADGSLAHFVVSSITAVSKAAFPTAAVFAPTGGPSLRLITCTGTFDTTQHHYIDSLIAWATALP